MTKLIEKIDIPFNPNREIGGGILDFHTSALDLYEFLDSFKGERSSIERYSLIKRNILSKLDNPYLLQEGFGKGITYEGKIDLSYSGLKLMERFRGCARQLLVEDFFSNELKNVFSSKKKVALDKLGMMGKPFYEQISNMVKQLEFKELLFISKVFEAQRAGLDVLANENRELANRAVSSLLWAYLTYKNTPLHLRGGFEKRPSPQELAYNIVQHLGVERTNKTHYERIACELWAPGINFNSNSLDGDSFLISASGKFSDYMHSPNLSFSSDSGIFLACEAYEEKGPRAQGKGYPKTTLKIAGKLNFSPQKDKRIIDPSLTERILSLNFSLEKTRQIYEPAIEEEELDLSDSEREGFTRAVNGFKEFLGFLEEQKIANKEDKRPEEQLNPSRGVLKVVN